MAGVLHLPVTNGTPCPDANVCNGSETCTAGACVAGTPLVVDDGMLCTVDACDPASGVTHTPLPATDPCYLNLDNDGDGYSPNAGDCDDHNTAVHPGAPETCNGVDDNCNGSNILQYYGYLLYLRHLQ